MPLPTEALVPVILSGGAGTRLWPASRAQLPKPFLRLPDGETLAEKTLRRAAALGATRALTVTGVPHLELNRAAESCLGPGQLAMRYLLEPVGRNTAPAVAAAALFCASRWGEDATLLVMPADHLIGDEPAFARAVAQAAELAAEGLLVTFGIRPERPDTGFGYIRRGAALGEHGFRVARFEEKPDAATAEAYLADGGYDWNAGIFCFTAGAVLGELETHAPELLAATRACWEATAGREAETVTLDAERFAAVPAISIDYALMERSRRAAVVPCRIGWSDVGSWTAVSDLVAADEAGNRGVGDVLFVDTRNAFVQGGHRVVAMLGVDDLVVVDTEDALLVAHRDAVQSVRAVVDALGRRGHRSAAAAGVPARREPAVLELAPGERLAGGDGEEALLVASGRVRCGERVLDAGDTLRRRGGEGPPVEALEPCRVVVVSLGER